ncbi:MAG: cytochrome P450 [Solirubrobacteraceae bacterium]
MSSRSRHGVTVARGFIRGAGLDVRAGARRGVRRLRGIGPAGRAPVTYGDPMTGTCLEHPERWYAELHARGPVHYCEPRDLFVLNGFDAVRAGARAHDVLISGEGVTRFRSPNPMLVSTDRPDHARLRRILARDFTKARIDLLRPQIEQLASDAVGRVLAAPNGVDAYDSLAAPIPLDITAAILGVPDADRVALRRWSDSAVTAFTMTPGPGGLVTLLKTLKQGSAMFAWFEGEIERRRLAPGDDALSRLIAYDDEQGRLTDDELLFFTLLLLVAGNETTTSVIMALLHNFARAPGEYEKLLGDPEHYIPRAIEEGLRWATPVPAFFRTARTPYQAGAITIPAAARVMVSFAAANRDPSRFSDPDRFDLDRQIDEHLAFGSGIHFCLGSHLARLELRIVLETLLRRVARIEARDQPRWRQNPSLRGIDRLTVNFQIRNPTNRQVTPCAT